MKDSLDRDTNDLRRREAGERCLVSSACLASQNVLTPAMHSACPARAALANQESIQESKLRAMRQAVDLYRGRLGLEFRKGAHLNADNSLQLFGTACSLCGL